MKEAKSILLTGVGGQGTILASKILTQGLMESGYDVKMSEIHGMSQRGGSVTTQIRYGEKVNAPTVGEGQADLLVAFEEMEAYRYLEYLKPSGKVIINDYRLPSAPILMGKADYPEGLIDEIKKKVTSTKVIKAADIAKELGHPKAMNIVLLGALVKGMGLEDLDWERILKANIKPKYVETNLQAFAAGMKAVE